MLTSPFSFLFPPSEKYWKKQLLVADFVGDDKDGDVIIATATLPQKLVADDYLLCVTSEYNHT